MRKSEREINAFDDITDVLSRCDTIRLGIHAENYPYVVPLSFGYEVADGKIVIYFHGAKEGMKHELLTADNRVCVEADICHRFTEVGISVTTEYESVIGFGKAVIVTGDDAAHGIDLLLEHCGFTGFAYDRAALEFVGVYKITLESITGKRRSVL